MARRQGIVSRARHPDTDASRLFVNLDDRPLRILTFTTLYPSAAKPGFGLFVEQRLLHLLATGKVEARVLAPVPYFPFRHAAFGDYAAFARTPKSEIRQGVAVDHPRFLAIPRIGAVTNPTALYLSARRFLSRRRDLADVDLIDAHYFYPDGVAAALLAQWLGKPLVVTARGSDINILAKNRIQRDMMLWAAKRAKRLIAVSEALKTEMTALGMAAPKIAVIRNGVDPALFRETGREAARARLGVKGPMLLMVGNLVPLKGHRLAIDALAALPEATLAIAGDGPERGRIGLAAAEKGVADRVLHLGRVPQASLPEIYSAADALVLASSSEGLANVLLESMACGTPVIAADVGGSREVVDSPAAGLLLRERSASAIVEAARRLLSEPPNRAETRRHAERFDWRRTSQQQLDLFQSVLQAAKAP